MADTSTLGTSGSHMCFATERTMPGAHELRRNGIQAKIAPPGSPHGSGLGRQRWVVERTIAWLHQHRRLRVRYERRDDIHEAFLAIGCSLICLKLLRAQESFC